MAGLSRGPIIKEGAIAVGFAVLAMAALRYIASIDAWDNPEYATDVAALGQRPTDESLVAAWDDKRTTLVEKMDVNNPYQWNKLESWTFPAVAGTVALVSRRIP